MARQREDCEAKAAAMGWTVASVYEDNDKSASTGVRRPQYERLLADLEARLIDAVVVWDLDRLTRRPIEVEHFIDLADRHGIALASVGGDVDLSTDNGRLFARVKGAVARSEVERKSTRQKRANQQRAEAGRPAGGRRPFGYSPGGLEEDPTEAAEVRKVAEALLGGTSLRAAVADLNARGVRTTMGGQWHTTEMRRLLTNPRYAGKTVYRGEVIGSGVQPAILDAETFAAVGAVLSDPSRHRAGRPQRYLLSGVAKCDVCGGRVYGVKQPRGRVYHCESRRHFMVKAEPVDDFVVRLVAGRLAAPDAATMLAPPDRRDDAAALREAEHGLRARLDGLAEAFAAGDIDRQQLRSGTERLRADLDRVTDALAGLAQAPVLTDLLAAEDVQAAVRDLFERDLDRLRSVLDVLLEVRLAPPGRGARGFMPERVLVTWLSAAA